MNENDQCYIDYENAIRALELLKSRKKQELVSSFVKNSANFVPEGHKQEQIKILHNSEGGGVINCHIIQRPSKDKSLKKQHLQPCCTRCFCLLTYLLQ